MFKIENIDACIIHTDAHRDKTHNQQAGSHVNRATRQTLLMHKVAL